MKHRLTALALAAMAAGAQAQSNVTVYGTIDGGLRYKTNAAADGKALLSANSGTFNNNRLGFKAAEDLGGAAPNALFDRTSIAGIATAIGNVRLANGFQYTGTGPGLAVPKGVISQTGASLGVLHAYRRGEPHRTP